MTPKQTRFVEEYLVDLNGTQAAIRAGYSPHTANEQAARLLANASIREAIEQAQAKRSRRTAITADWVLRKLVRNRQRADAAEEFAAVNKSLELIGRHLGMFVDRVDVNAEVRQRVIEEVVDAPGD